MPLSVPEKDLWEKLVQVFLHAKDPSCHQSNIVNIRALKETDI